MENFEDRRDFPWKFGPPFKFMLLRRRLIVSENAPWAGVYKKIFFSNN